MNFFIEKESSFDTTAQILSIVSDYTEDYFTDSLPQDTKNDLKFQQAALLKDKNKIVSFIVFPCLDGSPHITLMATDRKSGGKGYGKLLMQHFVGYLTSLGFHSIELLTVLPQSKPIYQSTVAFYESAGFSVIKEYPDLWESGAVKMRKTRQVVLTVCVIPCVELRIFHFLCKNIVFRSGSYTFILKSRTVSSIADSSATIPVTRV